MTPASGASGARHGGAGTSPHVSALWGAGLVLIFVGERLVGGGNPRGVLDALGAAAVLGACLWRLVRAQRARQGWRRAERALALLEGAGAVALLLYALQSDLVHVEGKVFAAVFPRLSGALAALWPALLGTAIAALVLAQMAYAASGLAAHLESGRVTDALHSGLGLGAALTFAFAISYTAAERDKKVDLSYFRTARPGDSTLALVRSLSEPIEITLFFPPSSEVREEVISYVKELGAASPQVRIAEYDHALEPLRAKDLGVFGNGAAVFARGGRKEQLTFPLELRNARNNLKRLDRDVQKKLLAVAKPPRTLYLTTGHDERVREKPADVTARAGIRDLAGFLEDQGWTVKPLGAAEGLAADVPSDAGVVMVIGPTKPFLPEESASLRRAFERGGRLLIALDPEAGPGQGAADLLAPLGLVFSPLPLANDQIFARKTNQKADRWNLATGTFSSHPAVTTVGKFGMRAPLVTPGVGTLEAAKERPADVTIDFCVRSLPSTWRDDNKNYELDEPGESRRALAMAAAVSRKPGATAAPAGASHAPEEGRAVVVADSDFLADGAIAAGGNGTFTLDVIRWLAGDEALAGEINTEEDAPIVHTRKQDALWFYLTIFVAPALVLGLGWTARRRRQRRTVGVGSTQAERAREASP